MSNKNNKCPKHLNCATLMLPHIGEWCARCIEDFFDQHKIFRCDKDNYTMTISEFPESTNVKDKINKFNVGQHVYQMLFHTIQKFIVMKITCQDTPIFPGESFRYFYYDIKDLTFPPGDGGVFLNVMESDIFATKEEAQAELDRRPSKGLTNV